MNEAAQLLKRAGSIFDQKGIPWALVGGWAVSIRTEPRFTRDLDVAVAVQTDDDAERYITDFIASRFQVAALVEQTATKRLATVRLLPPYGHHPGLLLDLLFASSGIESEICAAAERLAVFPDVIVPVARLEHLLAIKILAREDESRPQDQLDIRMLLRFMDEKQLSVVRHLLNVITVRGYHRGKNLQVELNDFMRAVDEEKS